MKILIIINALHYGGAEKQAVMDANALANCGHHITIGYYEKGALMNLLSKKITHYNFDSNNILFASLQLLFHLFVHRYDAIHGHLFWAESVSFLAGKPTGHKVVFNEHGLGLCRKWYHILFMQVISLFADKIITSCNTNQNVRIEREKLSRNKLATIYNSFDEDNAVKHKTDIPDFLRDGKKFVIGFVGRFTSVKRLEIFIDMTEQLILKIPELMVVLVGDGEEKEKIESEIVKRNLNKYFHLPGFVSHPTQYLKIFDIFVLPSIIEGFSIALLEAGAYGVPALAFNVGGNQEIIQDGITGYIVPDKDITLLNEKITYFYKNKERRNAMGLAARNFIRHNFSMNKRLDSLMKLYKEL